ncbi:putative aminopeptidase Y precursor [Cladorrhinum sp. PSN259]|nr:putative aminopeptidase Y precursor [Cladorrhinum sp. PSN259]
MPGVKSIALNGLVALSSVSALAAQKPLYNDDLDGLSLPPYQPYNTDLSKLPLVETEALQAKITGDWLSKGARNLYKIARSSEEEYGRPTRVIGSRGHYRTIAYIRAQLQPLKWYYEIYSQPFSAVSGNIFEWRLVLDKEVPKDATPMGLTPPTKNKEPVNGNLIRVENVGCDAKDYPKEVAGNIAFIKRGTCPFGTKSELAGKAGAVAAIVYNNENGPVAGTLGTPTPDHVATFGLPGEEAKKYLDRLENNDTVPATAYIDAVVEEVKTYNVIAQTRGGDQDNCVMLGAHSDSVGEGPGINDDGSGTISLIEVARHLSNFKVNNCVRFAWWSAEEEGLLGSDHYVANLSPEENKKIRLFMDYDMLASPNFAYQVYDARDKVNPVGSQALRDLYVDWYTKHGLNYTFIAFDGRSDYDGFIRHGIPAGGIATGAEGIKTESEAAAFGGEAGVPYDVCYHLLCDNVQNVNLTAWEVNTRLVAHSVAQYAVSFEGFPERTLESINLAAADDRESYEKKTKYHGSKLFI